MKMLKTFSFDYTENVYPRWSYKTDGAAVISKNFIKLIPPVANRAGEIILRKKLRSQSFQADVNFKILSSQNNNPYGFAIWFINSEKPIKDSKGSLFGFKGDYSGLGVFVMKHTSGSWIIHANQNSGMEEYKISENAINENNGCTILGPVENFARTVR